MIATKPDIFCQKIGHFTTLVVVTIALLLSLTVNPLAQGVEINVEIPVDLDNEQEVKTLPIRVVNEAGEPVAGVKIKPWALRSSQGHGTWRKHPDERSGIAPEEVLTDDNGEAEVAYPLYRDLSEKTLTTSVSVAVDHPKYAYGTHHIDAPSLEEEREEIVLEQGASVIIEPLLDGKLAPTDNLYAITSGNRSWLSGSSSEITDQGLMQLPVVQAGKVAIRVVRIVEERATHFGPLLVLNLKQGEKVQHSVALEPAITVTGKLSSDSSRPFHDGRVVFETLHLSRDLPDCTWYSWAPVDADGKFTFSWPAKEALEIIALTKEMMATRGKAPSVVEKVRDPDPYERAHVYSPEQLSKEIAIPMRPLVPCEVLTIDENGKPLNGINVVSCPNIQWWNRGSQIYCSTLIRAERISRTGNYFSNVDRESASEFSQTTNEKGLATLMLPEGSESIYAYCEAYEIPISVGRRDIDVKLNIGETTKLKIVMQPRGQEQLGDWDKLAGIVFGCSTREGKRICALPGVKAKVAKFRDLLNEAENPRDPKILVEAYSYIVDVLTEAGDAEEASKWQSKVDEQKALLDS